MTNIVAGVLVMLIVVAAHQLGYRLGLKIGASRESRFWYKCICRASLERDDRGRINPARGFAVLFDAIDARVRHFVGDEPPERPTPPKDMLQ